MELQYHGGLCCGIQHLRGFGNPDEQSNIFNRPKQCWEAPKHDRNDGDEFDRIVRDVISKRQILVEAVLVDYQLEKHGGFWRKKLEEAGFVLVTRCRNMNSGNMINVFHYHPNRKDS